MSMGGFVENNEMYLHKVNKIWFAIFGRRSNKLLCVWYVWYINWWLKFYCDRYFVWLFSSVFSVLLNNNISY